MTAIHDGSRPPQAVRRERARRHKGNGHRRLFLVDVALFLAFVVVVDLPLTGLPIHEWLGIFVGVATIVHLVQHGNWIAAIGKRIRSATSFLNRLNYVMMSLLFLAYGTIIASGLVISEVALPFVGITPVSGDFWLWLHVSSVIFTIWLTALHVAFNWKWTKNALNRYLGQPLGRMISGARS